MQKNADSFNKNISSYIGEIGELHSFEREKTFLTPELLSLPQTEIVREIKFLLNIESYHGQYFGWGFTPKLTETLVDKAELETNCLGRSILFGTYLTFPTAPRSSLPSSF